MNRGEKNSRQGRISENSYLYNTRIESVLFQCEYPDLRNERGEWSNVICGTSKASGVDKCTSYECTLDPCIVHNFFVQMHRMFVFHEFVGLK